jgi:PPE family
VSKHESKHGSEHGPEHEYVAVLRGEQRPSRTTQPMGPQQLGYVRWEGYDHRELWNMIMDARPDDVFDRHYRWVGLGENLIEVNRTVQAELNRLFQTWQGTAAMSAALSNTRLLQWSQETAEITQRIGQDLGTYGNALVEARKRMPQPRHVVVENDFLAGRGATVWSGPENAFTLVQLLSDHRATYQQRAEAKQRAVEVMQTFEADAVQVKEQMPAIPPAPNIVRPAPPGHQEPPPDPPGPGPGGHGIGPLPSPTTAASVGGVGAGGAGGYGDVAAGYGGAGGYGGAAAGGYGAGGYGAGGYGAGGDGYGAGRFGGGSGHGFGGAAGGAAGRGGAHGQAFDAAPAAAARGGGGNPAAAGRGGAGMLYPPVAGGVRDDDEEKPLAPYLVDDDGLFDDERTVAPPVLGA